MTWTNLGLCIIKHKEVIWFLLNSGREIWDLTCCKCSAVNYGLSIPHWPSTSLSIKLRGWTKKCLSFSASLDILWLYDHCFNASKKKKKNRERERMSARNIEIEFYFWKMTLHTSCKCTQKWAWDEEQSLRAKMIARAALWLPSTECCESAAFTVHNTFHTWRTSLDFEVLWPKKALIKLWREEEGY